MMLFRPLFFLTLLPSLVLASRGAPADPAGYLAPVIGELGREYPRNRTVNLVFHGHSVPAGYFKTPHVDTLNAYPAQLQRELKARFPTVVLNAIVTAIGGEDSVRGAARFDRDVLALRPDVVCIDYALNDRRVPEEQVEASWLSMIRAAKDAGVPVVLITPTGDATADMANPEDPLTQRAALIRKIAVAEKVILADVSAAWVAELAKGIPQAELLSQVNHPNLCGHQLAADTIIKALAEAGL